MEYLYYVSQAVGAVIIVGVLVLLFKRIVTIDAESKRVTEFEFPLFGKLKTQSPVLALAIIGTFLVVYPLRLYSSEPVEIKLEGTVDAGGKTVDIVVVAIPNYHTTIHKAKGPTPFSMLIPLLPKAEYRVRYSIDDNLAMDLKAIKNSGRLTITDFVYQPELTETPVLSIGGQP